MAYLIDADIDPYPASMPRSHALSDVRDDSGAISVVRRVVQVCDHSGVLFADLRKGGMGLQVMFTADRPETGLAFRRETVDPGDLVRVTDTTCRNRSGELSIHTESWSMATKCLTPPPDKHRGLRNTEVRVR